MKYFKVTNPDDKVVKLNFKGHDYFIGAKTTEAFPEDLARHFVYVYGFMSIDGEADGPVLNKGLPKEEPVVEGVKEEVKEEVEEPKKEVKKVAKKTK